VQLGLADGAEVAAVRGTGNGFAGLASGRAGHRDLGAQRGRPRDHRTAAEGLVVRVGDGDQPSVTGADVPQQVAPAGAEGLCHDVTLAARACG
jgi:hypothetical protein